MYVRVHFLSIVENFDCESQQKTDCSFKREKKTPENRDFSNFEK